MWVVTDLFNFLSLLYGQNKNFEDVALGFENLMVIWHNF